MSHLMEIVKRPIWTTCWSDVCPWAPVMEQLSLRLRYDHSLSLSLFLFLSSALYNYLNLGFYSRLPHFLPGFRKLVAGNFDYQFFSNNCWYRWIAPPQNPPKKPASTRVNPTPRIPNSYVTKSVKWRYLGNQAWYHRYARVKTTGKKSWAIKKDQQESPIFQKMTHF